MNNSIEIGKLLYFDENKFKRHVNKRIDEGNIEDESDYIGKILEILNNHERLLITEDDYRLKYLLLKSGDWLLFIDEKYKVWTCFKLEGKRFKKVEDLLDEFLTFGKINRYMEVNDENSIYKRFIKRLQERN